MDALHAEAQNEGVYFFRVGGVLSRSLMGIVDEDNAVDEEEEEEEEQEQEEEKLEGLAVIDSEKGRGMRSLRSIMILDVFFKSLRKEN